MSLRELLDDRLAAARVDRQEVWFAGFFSGFGVAVAIVAITMWVAS